MKKLSFLFVAFALVAFISFYACKSSTESSGSKESADTEEVMEESEGVAEEEMAPDTAAMSTEEAEETPAEEAAE